MTFHHLFLPHASRFLTLVRQSSEHQHAALLIHLPNEEKEKDGGTRAGGQQQERHIQQLDSFCCLEKQQTNTDWSIKYTIPCSFKWV